MKIKFLYTAMISFFCLFIFSLSYSSSQEKEVTYKFILEPIDVIIPCAVKDKDKVEYCLECIKKNGKGIKRVILLSGEKFLDDIEWFNENDYPFSKKDIALEIFGDKGEAENYLKAPRNRISWLYQQLLKLYAFLVIPNISSNILIVDADTFFLRPVSFMDEKGNPLFHIRGEYTPSYFNHMQRLLPGLEKIFPQYSGIAHHMLMQKNVLEDLFREVESYHKCEFWKAMCRCIDKKDLFCAFSEYEIYFNFIFSRSKQPQIRKLKGRQFWNPKRSIATFLTDYKDYDLISVHRWL